MTGIFKDLSFCPFIRNANGLFEPSLKENKIFYKKFRFTHVACFLNKHANYNMYLHTTSISVSNQQTTP